MMPFKDQIKAREYHRGYDMEWRKMDKKRNPEKYKRYMLTAKQKYDLMTVSEREKYRAMRRELYRQNRELRCKQAKICRDKNPDVHRKANRAWAQKNRKYRNEYNRKWVMSHPEQVLRYHISASLRQSIGSKPYSKRAYWERLLGYDREQLMNHIEGLFLEGMSWNNHGEWHIDHIKPVSKFDVKEFKKCWALDNLQPLWADDNMSKGARG